MLPTHFRVAMSNRLRVGPYATPARTRDPVSEWLIVERLGAGGEILFISDTAPADGASDGDAPMGLAALNTIVALLAEPNDTPEFLIVRQRPDAITTPGIFFPADGCARLSGGDGQLRLNAFGRHAHSRGTLNGATVLNDVPNPAPAADGALNWHFAAEQRPWPGQA